MESTLREGGRAPAFARKPVASQSLPPATSSFSPPNPPQFSPPQHAANIPPTSWQVQSSTTFASPSLLPAVNCPNICSRCKSGIPYEINYHECGWCHILLCESCTSQHPPSHQSSMVRRMSRHTHARSIRDPRSCIHCKESTHVRFQCRTCQISICANCYNSVQGPRHEHADFIVMEVPEKMILGVPLGTECRDCVFRPGIGHCDCCLTAVPSNDILMMCGTCEVTFNGSINICRKCHLEHGHLHDSSHQWLSVATQLCTDAAQKPGIFGCTQCPRRSDEITNLISQHSHSSYIAFLGPRALDIVLANVWRICQRKPIRDDAPSYLNPTAPNELCDWCGNKFLSFPYQCKTCPDFVLCDICYPTARYLHSHGPASILPRQQVVASRAPPPKKQFKLGKLGIKSIDRQVEKLDKNGKVSRGLQNTGQFGGKMMMAFMRGAIGAEVNIANANNANNGGGGYVNNGGGFDTSGGGSWSSMPTSDPGFTSGLQQDTWASTSSGASDPIQGSSGSS